MVKKKILIVDDEKSVGEMLKPYLNDEGLDALTAHNRRPDRKSVV